MSGRYQPQKIESEIQLNWQKNATFSVKESLGKKPFYCLSMLPYPSGQLHMGHVRNYVLGDAISRHQSMQGRHVLQPIGWDAFGLPAENAAIQHDVTPAEWTQKNIANMRQQLERLGLAYDWHREITTCKSDYYRWNQWLFLQMYKRGLAYQKESVVNWDPVDQTVLANEQVVDGRGWRSGALVEKKKINQWFFKITDYADALLNDLETLQNWPEQVKRMQQNWIGKSSGTLLTFKIQNSNQTLDVFTTRIDTLYGVTYLAIAPDHPLIADMPSDATLDAFVQACQQTSTAEADMATMPKKGHLLPIQAVHPLTQKLLPIFVGNYVMMSYGTGAVMAVPAHDQRDHAFAKKYDLRIQPVIETNSAENWDYDAQAMTDEGKLIHSDACDGMTSEQATLWLQKTLSRLGAGQAKQTYRLRDWGISRQRYWGTPIPIVYCEKCGVQPVPEDALPVALPVDLSPETLTNTLQQCESFYHTTCPTCQGPAVRETDTMDTFVDSSWYYARYTCPDQQHAMLDDRAKFWTPVDQYIGGVEHATMHLLYARFIHKVLRDLDLVNSNEPFTALLTQGMVLKDGTKMSKSKGNTVAPMPLIEHYGADTVRLFAMFAAPPEQSLEWQDTGVEGAYKFLKKLWSFCDTHQATVIAHQKTFVNEAQRKAYAVDYQKPRHDLHQVIQQIHFDYKRLQMNTVVSGVMKLSNIMMDHVVADGDPVVNAMWLHESLQAILTLLNPICPHICEQLWQSLQMGPSLVHTAMIDTDPSAFALDEVTLTVQVNGKVRGQIVCAADAEQNDVLHKCQENPNIAKHITEDRIKKVIYIPRKIINVVVAHA